MDGKFITIEGAEGAGKTTQIKMLSAYLEQNGYTVFVSREPGGTKIGEQIREVLLDKNNTAMTQMTELLLYVAARAQHVEEVILPHIEKGDIVLCDRFIDSNLCYQGYGRGIPVSTILSMNELAIGGFYPQMTFYLDILPEEGLKRKAGEEGHKLDRLENENIAFHSRVCRGFRELWEQNPERIKHIDASKSAAAIHKEIVSYMEKLFTCK